ncbi:MAG: S41 family peptidase [Pirellulaceae bacterium]
MASSRRLSAIMFLLFSLNLVFTSLGLAQELAFDKAKIFDEVWTNVRDQFFDARAIEANWEKARETFRPQAIAANSHDEFAEVMSQMLKTLNASHTAYFPTIHPKRFQLLGIFEFLVPPDRHDLLEFESIGFDTETIDGKVFVRSIYEGFPAAEVGLRFGDEIVSIDDQPFHAIESFRGKRTVTVACRRSRDGAIESLSVPVAKLNGRTMFETSLEKSARKIERDGKSIAYVHVWSYAGTKYQDALRNLLLFGDLKSCDALVLDLRDGWGGASFEYLNLFSEPIAVMVSKPRTGDPTNYSGVWGKPVVLLTNERSTSGKELFSYGFQKLKLGEVVGTTTAGAVLAGKPTLLSNGDVLYLAVSNIEVDGQRLEGKGVAPTIEIARPIPYANGADPQLEKALEVAREKLR